MWRWLITSEISVIFPAILNSQLRIAGSPSGGWRTPTRRQGAASMASELREFKLRADATQPPGGANLPWNPRPPGPPTGPECAQGYGRWSIIPADDNISHSVSAISSWRPSPGDPFVRLALYFGLCFCFRLYCELPPTAAWLTLPGFVRGIGYIGIAQMVYKGWTRNGIRSKRNSIGSKKNIYIYIERSRWTSHEGKKSKNENN